MMENSKESFIYYLDWARELEEYPHELAAKVERALRRYVLLGEEPKENEVKFGLFGIMRRRIDKDNTKWENKRDTLSKNAKKGWEKQKQANASKCKQKQANAYVNVNANVNANVNEKESKPKKKVSLSLNERKEDFKKSLERYREKYPSEMLNDFYMYWTELNPAQTKMRFELEKTWETGKRLSTWERNQKKFENG